MRKKTTLLILLACFLALLTAGCKKEPKLTAAPAAAPAANPAAAPAPAPGASPGLGGKVTQTMNSGGYTYAELDTGSGKKWAAVKETELAVGQEVTIEGAALMKGFKSKTLDRTFDEIYFGALKGAAGAPTEGAMGQAGKMPKGHGNMVHGQGDQAKGAASGTKKQPQMDVGDALEKAPGPGGRTVAEIFAQGAPLTHKTVVLRGKVVKINRGIMGRNWVHFQDGSGSVETGDHDLTVTTKEDAKLGEVLLVKGIIRTNKDFGAGYVYAVIMEDATFTR